MLEKLKPEAKDHGVVYLYSSFQENYLFKDDDKPQDAIFQVMEYLPGLTVLDFVNQEILDNRYSSTEFCNSEERKDIVKQLVDILAYFHHNHFVHLDFTLENLMFNEDNRVVAIDFGLAQECKDNNNEVAIFSGKRIYLPPETYTNHSHYDGTKRDIWSLGVCLYTLYSGNYFLTNKDTIESVCNILKYGFDYYLQSHYPLGITWPKPLKDLISRCLYINPNKRPSIDDIIRHPWIESSRRAPKTFTFITRITNAVKKSFMGMKGKKDDSEEKENEAFLNKKTSLFFKSPDNSVTNAAEEKGISKEEKAEPSPSSVATHRTIPQIKNEEVQKSAPSPGTTAFMRSLGGQKKGIVVRDSPSEFHRVMKFMGNNNKDHHK